MAYFSLIYFSEKIDSAKTSLIKIENNYIQLYL